MQLPRLYLNGFPKSGLHMAELMVATMYSPFMQKNWLGTNAWTTEKTNLDKLPILAVLEKGNFIKGHSGYSKELDEMLVGLEFGMVLVYRDLRDVVVSQAYHILSDDENLKHPARELYPDDLQGVMKLVITGVGKFDGLFERWATFEPWLRKSWVLPVKYEELRKRTNKVARQFLEYVIALELLHENVAQAKIDQGTVNAFVKTMVKATHHKSITFRRGKTGSWRYEFTPELVTLFKEHDKDNMLVKLGFEKDKDWH